MHDSLPSIYSLINYNKQRQTKTLRRHTEKYDYISKSFFEKTQFFPQFNRLNNQF